MPRRRSSHWIRFIAHVHHLLKYDEGWVRTFSNIISQLRSNSLCNCLAFLIPSSQCLSASRSASGKRVKDQVSQRINVDLLIQHVVITDRHFLRCTPPRVVGPTSKATCLIRFGIVPQKLSNIEVIQLGCTACNNGNVAKMQIVVHHGRSVVHSMDVCQADRQIRGELEFQEIHFRICASSFPDCFSIIFRVWTIQFPKHKVCKLAQGRLSAIAINVNHKGGMC